MLSGIGVSAFVLTSAQQRSIQNTKASLQAYYGAEAGIEDALFRLETSLTIPAPGSYPSFSIGGVIVQPDISAIVGGIRTITATGDDNNRIRKAEVVYAIDTTEASFNFGAQIGDGGMEMQLGSKIVGNIFSNGTIFGSGTITETAIVAGNGNKIDGSALTIKKDAQVHTCKNATIEGDLTVVSGALGGGNSGCIVLGSILPELPSNITPVEFPVTPTMIADWKVVAELGGTITPSPLPTYTISGDTTLGPKKINGNLIVNTGLGNELTLTGTIWITGTLEIKNNATVELDPSYGDLSGMMIVDGEIFIRPGVFLKGTSSPVSFLMLVGMSSSTLESNPAMEVKNTAQGAILFTPNGLMVIDNTVDLVEATTKQLLLKNNATITYDLGLANVNFTTGPSGGWSVISWKEVE